MSLARMPTTSKRYDRAYFDRWYRDPRHSVVRDGVAGRRVQLAVATAEFVLERPIRNVLDVGCGEATWRAWLKRARPGVSYRGVDSSEYVLRRYGRRRGIQRGTFGTLGRLDLAGPYDLIVCADVLHYLETSELRSGLAALAKLLGGLAYVEIYTREDDTVGDGVGFQPRSAATYRRLFAAAGLVHVGPHCFVRAAVARTLTSFEQSGGA
ncbi:MAG TPA: class I SAM-dependent methyltransferase [Candidatus Limnocylindria bacterium]|nr:class I SAM-dependent methyltransferase [Candidatus Limnocylindria bacterium]